MDEDEDEDVNDDIKVFKIVILDNGDNVDDDDDYRESWW